MVVLNIPAEKVIHIMLINMFINGSIKRIRGYFRMKVDKLFEFIKSFKLSIFKFDTRTFSHLNGNN